jgi:hypothetical protein
MHLGIGMHARNHVGGRIVLPGQLESLRALLLVEPALLSRALFLRLNNRLQECDVSRAEQVPATVDVDEPLAGLGSGPGDKVRPLGRLPVPNGHAWCEPGRVSGVCLDPCRQLRPRAAGTGLGAGEDGGQRVDVVWKGLCLFVCCSVRMLVGECRLSYSPQASPASLPPSLSSRCPACA